MDRQTHINWRQCETQARADAAGELAREVGLSDLQAALIEHVMKRGEGRGVRDEEPRSVLASSKRAVAAELGCSLAGLVGAEVRLEGLGILAVRSRGQRGSVYTIAWPAVFALGRCEHPLRTPANTACEHQRTPLANTSEHQRTPANTTAHPDVSANEEPHAAPRRSAPRRGRASARVGRDARGELSLSLLYSSSTSSEGEGVKKIKTPGRVVDWRGAVALFERASELVAGQVLPVRSPLGGLVLGLAGLAVAIDQPSLLLEACAVVRRRRPADTASYLRAVVANLAWERIHGAEPGGPAEKSEARGWLKEELATIRAGIPPPAELRKLAAEVTTDH